MELEVLLAQATPGPEDEFARQVGAATDAECGGAFEYFTNGPGVNHPKRPMIWRLLARIWQDKATIEAYADLERAARARHETAIRGCAICAALAALDSATGAKV